MVVKRFQDQRRKLQAIVGHLNAVRRISLLNDEDAIMTLGNASLPRLPATPLRVATWNIFKGTGATHLAKDFAHLMDISDIVLVQEALLSETWTKFFAEHAFQATHCTSYCRADGVRDGVMTLARTAGIHECFKIASPQHEPLFRTPKTCLVNFYPLLGSPHSLMVVNMHARLWRTPNRAVADIDHLCAALPIHEGPTIFGGDFNTFSRTYLDKIAKQLAKHGFSLVEVPEDPRGRFKSLDHFFVRGLTYRNAHVRGDLISSDHWPVVVEFLLDEPG